MSIYSYINTSRNWINEKLCANTTLAGRSVFPISTIYNMAQKTSTKEWRKIFRAYIELYQYGS